MFLSIDFVRVTNFFYDYDYENSLKHVKKTSTPTAIQTWNPLNAGSSLFARK